MAARIINNRKSHWIIRDLFRTFKMELFANIVKCIQLLTIFAKNSILDISKDWNCISDKTEQKLDTKKLGLQSLQISFNFKFSFILTSLPCGKTQFQYTCLYFRIDSPIQLSTYHIKQPPFTCLNSS